MLPGEEREIVFTMKEPCTKETFKSSFCIRDLSSTY